MLPPHPEVADSGRLADRLAAARRAHFVGRDAELAMFRALLTTSEPATSVIFLHGVGGIGKTTLVRTFSRLATEHGRHVIHLDGRDIEPTPAEFYAALSHVLSPQSAQSAAVGWLWPPAPVLLVDTYEMLAPLDAWLRETVLTDLPDQSLVVLAGRNPPSIDWRADGGWASLTRVVPLGGLLPAESRAYLTARGVPTKSQVTALNFTNGHPLALALVADLMRTRPGLASLSAAEAPDVVRDLVERLVRDVPSAVHAQALTLCALAWATTQDLLAAVLPDGDSGELFAWLRDLSCIDQGPHGLYPHDLAREVLDGEARWREPVAYAALRARVIALLRSRLSHANRQEHQALRLELLYLNRHDPYMRDYFDWQALNSVTARPAVAADRPGIVAMVEAHEGAESAALAAYWLSRQPEAFLAFIAPDGSLFGFMATLVLAELTTDDHVDPAVVAAQAYASQHGPPRAGQEVIYLRFWMSRETYQRVGPALNLTATNSIIEWTTRPHLAWNFIAVADPDFMEPHFTSIHMWRTPAADFSVGERRYGVFSHDWRVEPPAAWQERAPHHVLATPRNVESMPEVGLTQEQFTSAVRHALRTYHQPTQFLTNPLARTRLVATNDGATVSACLQAHVRDAIGSLAAHPRDLKFHRALWHTYIEPAPSQEAAAELLGVPFNTYRYRLTRGIDRITEWLWLREQALREQPLGHLE